MSRRTAALLIAALIAAPLALAGCHTDSQPWHVNPNAFAWNGTVAPGSWLHIRNTGGRISVVGSDSPAVEVHASTRWRGRGNTAGVHFVQRTTDDGVIICAVYGSQDTCTTESSGHGSGATVVNPFDFLGGDGGRASVDYVVRVPAGVKVDVRTVIGEIGVADVTSAVTAETVNGPVRVATRNGPVTAHSVNGSVTVAIDSLTTPGDIDLATVNGSITAQLPASFQGHVSLETTHGGATTDYTVAGGDSSSHNEISGTVGAGGRSVKLETVNGSVTLRKGS